MVAGGLNHNYSIGQGNKEAQLFRKAEPPCIERAEMGRDRFAACDGVGPGVRRIAQIDLALASTIACFLAQV